MRFDILTIFPEMFTSVINCSIQKRASDAGLISYHIHNIRDYSQYKHKNTDDYPFGGGNGMVMLPQPIFDCIEAVKTEDYEDAPYCIIMTPRGRLLTPKLAHELSKKKRLLILCGHYEGIDERVMELMDDEISTGEYVLTGGELPAMTLCDCVSRFIPGVLGTDESAIDESFSISGGLLEYPQYTRPSNFDGRCVPNVLLGGNHADIETWRRERSIIKTAQNRPDLIEKANLTPEELCLAQRYMSDSFFQRDDIIKIYVDEKRRLRIYTTSSYENIRKYADNIHWHTDGFIYATNCKKHIDAYKQIIMAVQFNFKRILNITDETEFLGLKPSMISNIKNFPESDL